jgi:Protein of unknown function (DUF2695)
MGCDHTRRLTEQWLGTLGHPVGIVTIWLEESGGCCGGEVLANGAPFHSTGANR